MGEVLQTLLGIGDDALLLNHAANLTSAFLLLHLRRFITKFHTLHPLHRQRLFSVHIGRTFSSTNHICLTFKHLGSISSQAGPKVLLVPGDEVKFLLNVFYRVEHLIAMDVVKVDLSGHSAMISAPTILIVFVLSQNTIATYDFVTVC